LRLGSIPISEHIERRIKSGADFVVCYADLNDFKPFNDRYGYWRGDEMIKLVAGTVLAHTDQQRDFVGHVGGDDFVLERRAGRLFGGGSEAIGEAEPDLTGGVRRPPSPDTPPRLAPLASDASRRSFGAKTCQRRTRRGFDSQLRGCTCHGREVVGASRRQGGLGKGQLSRPATCSLRRREVFL
jgi:hypothetical protein